MKKYVSIDIGGTSIKYGLLAEDGNILRREEVPTEAEKGGSFIVEKAIGIVQKYTETEQIAGICISTAGMVDPNRGEVFYASPLIPAYTGTRWKEIMEETFQIPCEVENDVNCAGLAEYISGAAKGSTSAVMLTIGTGIGGSMILDGKIHHGHSGSGFEIGYMRLNGSDFQTLGAASTLTKKTAALKNEPEALWDGRRIFQAAKEGDLICNQVIDEMVDVLGKGISNICYMANPEIVVLGGGIMAQEAFLKEKITTAVNRYLIYDIAKRTKFAFAKHQNDAGMLGAFYHFCQRQKK